MVQVEAVRHSDCDEIVAALAEHDLPLVPTRLGESSYLVRPPGD